jgi:DNA-binding CsgD family transcriptional regulator
LAFCRAGQWAGWRFYKLEVGISEAEAALSVVFDGRPSSGCPPSDCMLCCCAELMVTRVSDGLTTSAGPLRQFQDDQEVSAMNFEPSEPRPYSRQGQPTLEGSAMSCVYFTIRDNDSAAKIEAVLESRGYETQRNLAEIDGDLFSQAAATAARRYRLTAREQRTLEALLVGLDRQQIADALQVSLPTVKFHLQNLYTKLGVPNREEAFRKALFLDDPRWLLVPLRRHLALERIVDAADQVLRAWESNSPARLDRALVRLEQELAAGRREA